MSNITSSQNNCEKCDEKYTDICNKWCKPCQINYLTKKEVSLVQKKIFTSGNKRIDIDNLIREMQLKINSYNDIIFEWIPYNQFDNIEAINTNGFALVHSAVWKDGPLNYNALKIIYERRPNKIVGLKCLQSIANDFL